MDTSQPPLSAYPRGCPEEKSLEKFSLLKVLARARRNGTPALVVDVKRRSPRDGELISDEHLEPYVRALGKAGVDALATPTDARHFGGGLDTARRIRRLATVPLMRKEFFRSTAQIDESLEAGFDAVQLTLSTIPGLDLAWALKARAERIGLEVVVCAHNAQQVSDAVELGARIIGIANRDIMFLELDDGTVDTAEDLISAVPRDVYAISESALRTPADVAKASAAGADGVLIGTAIAQSADPIATVRALRGATLDAEMPRAA